MIIATKRNVTFVISLVLMVLVIWLFYPNKIFKEEIGVMINAVEKAKSVPKETFLDYEVKTNKVSSKELIAVVFNTDDEHNVGFIDEYGNVVAPPFLVDKKYDYYQTLKGSIDIRRYVDNYFQDSILDSSESIV